MPDPSMPCRQATPETALFGRLLPPWILDTPHRTDLVGNVEEVREPPVPLKRVDVEQHRPRGVGDVRHVHAALRAACQVPVANSIIGRTVLKNNYVQKLNYELLVTRKHQTCPKDGQLPGG
jgi:hypothetical protein